MNPDKLKLNLANLRVLTKAIDGHLSIESRSTECTTFSLVVPVEVPLPILPV
jgi:hypothetical protein